MRVKFFRVSLTFALLLASFGAAAWSATDSEARLSLASPAAAALQSGDVAIIVNPRNPARNISFDHLRKYFKAERGQWPDGTKVVVALRQPAGAAERGVVLRAIYGWDENYFQKYFRQGQFNETVQSAPKEMNSTYAMTRYVHYTPGAIGIVRADQVDASQVSVLSVDGRRPGDPGYRIR